MRWLLYICVFGACFGMVQNVAPNHFLGGAICNIPCTRFKLGLGGLIAPPRLKPDWCERSRFIGKLNPNLCLPSICADFQSYRLHLLGLWIGSDGFLG